MERATWPHTIKDIYKALDNIWGVVGAYDQDNNLSRLEKSIQSPIVYKVIRFNGCNEKQILSTNTYSEAQKDAAVKDFAQGIGFTFS